MSWTYNPAAVTSQTVRTVTVTATATGDGTTAADGTSDTSTGTKSVTVSVPTVDPVITTDTDSIYRLANRNNAPATPTGGTTTEEHRPSGWTRGTEPDATATQAVWRSQRTRSYSDGTFTSATAWGTPTRVADRLLALSELDTSGYDTSFAALIEVETATAGSNTVLYATSARGGPTGSIVDGDLTIDDATDITRVFYQTAQFGFNDNDTPGALALSTFFNTGGDGDDITLFVKTLDDEMSWDAVDPDVSGGAFARWDWPTGLQTVIEGLETGDRVIVAGLRTAAAVVVTGDGTAIEAEGSLGDATGATTAAGTQTGSGTAIEAEGTLGDATGTATAVVNRTGSGTAIEAEGSLSDATGTVPAAETVTVMSSQTAFEDAFNGGNIGLTQGRWRFDSGGTSATSNTGPGTNNPLSFSFMHTEASGGGTEQQFEDNGTVSFADLPVGTNRTVRLRLCIQGQFGDGDEGVQIEHRTTVGSGAWTEAAFIHGWAYTNSYGQGDTITDENGLDRTCVSDGGWIDVDVDIPDSAGEVQFHPVYILAGTNHQHDIALREFAWSFDGDAAITRTGDGTAIEARRLRSVMRREPARPSSSKRAMVRRLRHTVRSVTPRGKA